MKYLGFLTAIVKVSRWNNLLIVLCTQVLAAVFLADIELYTKSVGFNFDFLLLTFSTLLITFSGYLINDYYDVKIDYVNKPSEVVIGTQLKRRHAMFLHTVLNIIGVALGFLLSWKIGVINGFAAFSLWLYSNRLKRSPMIGNLIVATLTALSIGIIAIQFNRSELLITSFAVFAFGVTLVREIIKDIEDMEGDARFGCRTLPIIWGLRRTKNMLYILIFVFLITLFVLAMYLGNLTFTTYAVALLVPSFFFVRLLQKADTKREFGRLSQYCKYLMVSGVISMILF